MKQTGSEQKKRYNRIVVKVGSNVLTHVSGKLNLTRIDQLVRQLVDIKNQGREVLLVSSGAIGAGMGEIGFSERPKIVKEQQALAAIGQGLLIGLYNKFLGEYGERGAQILLTDSDLENRTRYLNAFNTMTTLLDYGVIPIINENDTIVTEEIEFGDNDNLSARVAGLVEADLLINLTDINGLYNKNPDKAEEDLQLIPKVEKLGPELAGMAETKGSKFGVGGMKAKIEAARIAVESGIIMVIGPGYEKNILLNIIEMLEEGENYNIGTTFLPEEDTLSKRKQWLCFNLTPRGELIVDRGAERALVERHKSLLPGGITEVKGNFNKGELVSIINPNGEEIGKGLVSYSSRAVKKIKGHHTSEIMDILGYFNQHEVLQRDNLVITEGSKNEC